MIRILVSMGDPSGVGSEIILKSIPKIKKRSIPVIVGDLEVLKETGRILGMDISNLFLPYMEGKKGDVELIDLGLLKDVRYGLVNKDYGYAAYQYVFEGLKRVLNGEVYGIVTCPINKKSFELANIQFTGHTEMLGRLAGVNDYVMMLQNRKMRVSLVTTHVPFKEVPNLLSVERVFKTIYITHRSLVELFNIDSPNLKVCGLNPHAGEEGLIGDEEHIIVEAIERAKNLNIIVSGPYPADSVFSKIDCDAYVSMYHDQGLIPLKTIDFKRTVNVTLGLPFVRTSPGHGTAFDIAGRGIADPTSFIEAYLLAEKLTKNLLTKSHDKD
ncbi:MAG: 4-hydroxythreonine-4-phosphate dehydrogenase PdxA [Desulfobacterota bacterium]|nr:4-hydroxythreonine-4-phosphate dehydrogenase PdxA [Thermodesulfobacteriota bacterium]MDW8001290.1 4-hydroxythreonine-4-phosphate dehydrogenase PdxA [Deltaproteobacteria bacterium]